MSQPAKLRIATHVEVTWLDAGETRNATCPNCNHAGPARQFLDIDYQPPGAAHHFVLQICPHCGVRFVDNQKTMDYATDELIEIGWHVYQTQIGCGIWPIAAPLTRIDKPAGARVLEIGGAYGFGLDFCMRARGWVGVGFDPSPLAEYGASELGLNITQDYFEEKDLGRGPYDVIIATEVIEHLAHPPEFLALMRRAITDTGILVLSTPDAAWITPELAAAQLMPLLSPGAHIVLQTADSLRDALLTAGFTHVTVLRSSMTLVAYRALYRTYLVERAKLSAPDSDLRLGFAGRGLFEAANDADLAAAQDAWDTLLPAVASRFTLDLETLTELPEGAASADLATLGRLMPLGLGMILFGRAMQLSSAGAPRPSLLPVFRRAAAAAAALQGALAQRSLGDGLSASILEAARGEIALCEAEAGDPAAVATLIDWSRRNASPSMPWRGFVGLVNAGAMPQAAILQTTLGLTWPDDSLPPDLRRDALLSLANFALAPAGDTNRAFAYAASLRAMNQSSEKPDQIVLEAFTRLVNAGDYVAANAAAATHDIAALTARTAGQAAADAAQALIMLDLANGDTLAAMARLTPVLGEPGTNVIFDALCADCFVRLVNEKRFAEAGRLAADSDLESRIAHCAPARREDALCAALLLELQTNGPAESITARLQTLTAARPDEDRLRDLTFAAFVTLVNADDIAAAAIIFPLMVPFIAKLRAPYNPAARNALFACGVFATSANNPARDPGRGAAIFARLRDDSSKRLAPSAAPDELFWPCLRGEIAALNELHRHHEANALLQDFINRYPGAPDDLRQLAPAA
jgi:2-polyprenyl-3-methyl-5-hydroxy-6-metoxy-1,4-benzoquinol methylase